MYVNTNYGAAFCQDLAPLLEELKALLDAAGAQGLSGDAVTSGQAVYDGLSGFAVYVPFTSACDRDVAEVQAAISRMRDFLGVSAPSPLRPDLQPGGPLLPAMPWWGYAALGIAALGAVGYVLNATSRFIPSRRR